jgi:hypothetical protein
MVGSQTKRRVTLAAFAAIVPAALLAARHGVDSCLMAGVVAGIVVGGIICFWRSRAPEAG